MSSKTFFPVPFFFDAICFRRRSTARNGASKTGVEKKTRNKSRFVVLFRCFVSTPRGTVLDRSFLAVSKKYHEKSCESRNLFRDFFSQHFSTPRSSRLGVAKTGFTKEKKSKSGKMSRHHRNERRAAGSYWPHRCERR